MLRRWILPLAASVIVPSVLFATVYSSQGENPVWGLFAGAIGLIGALSAEIVRLLQAPHLARRELEEAIRDAVQENRKPEKHEGLARLHVDMDADTANDDHFRAEER
jgi:hypothetical protein